MTDNTKSITLKMQAAKAEQSAIETATRKVFLGNFTYAEFLPYKGYSCVRITDEDGCGRALDTIMLDHFQLEKLWEALHGGL